MNHTTLYGPSCWGPVEENRSEQRPLLLEEQRTSLALRALPPAVLLS
uniref:Uncharacterized protein n=1 Tax=Nelumbo nucifera TaxID=4432 RepID=A0A822Z9X0_NELNU|nr:TPA_asm: hypothetical protein HUJ06_016195 [Nelumbo nucifera]